MYLNETMLGQVYVGFTDCDPETRQWETGLDCVLVSNYEGQNATGIVVKNITQPPTIFVEPYDSFDRRSVADRWDQWPTSTPQSTKPEWFEANSLANLSDGATSPAQGPMQILTPAPTPTITEPRHGRRLLELFFRAGDIDMESEGAVTAAQPQHVQTAQSRVDQQCFAGGSMARSTSV